jgi:hypothetical protein
MRRALTLFAMWVCVKFWYFYKYGVIYCWLPLNPIVLFLGDNQPEDQVDKYPWNTTGDEGD